MVFTPILLYLPLLGMKGSLKSNTNIFNGSRGVLNIDTIFLNPGQIVLKLLLLYPLLPLFTPYYPNFGHKYQGDLRGLSICFSMSACYEFVPGLYEF